MSSGADYARSRYSRAACCSWLPGAEHPNSKCIRHAPVEIAFDDFTEQLLPNADFHKLALIEKGANLEERQRFDEEGDYEAYGEE